MKSTSQAWLSFSDVLVAACKKGSQQNCITSQLVLFENFYSSYWINIKNIELLINEFNLSALGLILNGVRKIEYISTANRCHAQKQYYPALTTLLTLSSSVHRNISSKFREIVKKIISHIKFNFVISPTIRETEDKKYFGTVGNPHYIVDTRGSYVKTTSFWKERVFGFVSLNRQNFVRKEAFVEYNQFESKAYYGEIQDSQRYNFGLIHIITFSQYFLGEMNNA